VIEKKLSDFLCAVACGFRGKTSVIHCDCMRKCKSQILTSEENERSNEENAPEYENDSLPDDDEHLSANDLVSASVDISVVDPSASNAYLRGMIISL
jgi:hypothetical protein